jgi:hypothetical protein
MVNVMVNVEFRLICSSNRDADRFICRTKMPQAPNIGEGINIDGHPYVVHERGWTVVTDSEDTWVYMRVVSHHGAPEIGG